MYLLINLSINKIICSLLKLSHCVAVKISFIYIICQFKKNWKRFSFINILRKQYVYVIKLFIVVETHFSWYLESDLSYWLQIYQYHFSKVEESISKCHCSNAPLCRVKIPHHQFLIALIFWSISLILKLHSHFPKECFYLLQWNPLK